MTGLILLYHRVAAPTHDPQLLSVRPQMFAEHMEVLTSEFRPTPLSEIGVSANGARIPVAVTFDDGYADNFHAATPVLERFDVPATVFVTTGLVDHDRAFWWDRLEHLVFNGVPFPERLEVRVDGETRTWEMPRAERGAGTGRSWNVLQRPHTVRERLYVELATMLRPLPERDRNVVLDQLAATTSSTTPRTDGGRAMSSDEIHRLAAGNLVEIGAHTVTHPVLSALSNHDQRAEIEQSKAQLEEWTNRKIDSFSYPYGRRSLRRRIATALRLSRSLRVDYTRATVELVRHARFARACANSPGAVDRRANAYELPRIVVRDCDGDSFARQLRSALRGLPTSANSTT